MAWTNLIIGYKNYLHLPTCVISTDQEDANFPAANVALDQRQLVWKTTNGTVGHWVQAAWTTQLTVDLVSVFDTNVAAPGTALDWLISGAAATNIIDTTLYRLNTAGATAHIPQRSISLHTAEGLPLAQRDTLKLTYANAETVESVYIMGKVFCGAAITLARNYIAGITFTPEALTTTTITPNGATNVSRRASRMRVVFEVPALTRTNQDDIQTVVDQVSTHTPCVLVFDRDNAYGRRTFYGRFVRPPEYVHTRADRFNYRFEFLEDI